MGPNVFLNRPSLRCTHWYLSHCVSDWSGNDSSSSEDFIPLSKLLARPHSEEKQSRENRHSLTFSPDVKSKKDRSGGVNRLHRLSTILPVEVKYFQLYILWNAVYIFSRCSFGWLFRWQTFDKDEKKLCNSWETSEKSQHVNQIYWHKRQESRLQ